MEQLPFATSPALKTLFRSRFEAWSKRTRSTLEHLAHLCGVTPSYLGHINRYGRVPSKPVLILLALNLELEDPKELFEAAGMGSEWPFSSDMRLCPAEQRPQGFISLQVDMKGLSNAIAEVIRAEFRPRSLSQLAGGKALRVGLNMSQYFLCSKQADDFTGTFPEFLKLVLLSSQVRYELKDVPYQKALELLQSGDLDLYGPIYSTPKRIGQASFTPPFCRIPVAALWRKKPCAALPNLPKPETFEDLMGRGYEVAVLSESSSHHFAMTVLGLPTTRIVSCASPLECLERVTLSGIARPAHLIIADAPIVRALEQKHASELESIFCSPDRCLGYFENSIAVRPDWPELEQLITQTLKFLGGEKTMQELVKRHSAREIQDLIIA